MGGGTGWGLHKPFGLLTTHGLDGPGGGTIVVLGGLRGVVRPRDQVRDRVGTDGEQLAAAMARFTVAIVDIVFTVEAKLDGGVTVDRGAESRSEEGGEGDRKEGEHDGWGGVWGRIQGYNAIPLCGYEPGGRVGGLSDRWHRGMDHDAIGLEWMSFALTRNRTEDLLLTRELLYH